MNKKRFQGTGTALVTPFRADGAVDEDALRRIVELQVRGGIDMILPCGTTGEGATLEPEEVELVVRTIIEQVNGRVPVIVGAGSNSTTRAVKATERAKQLGAAAVLSVGPYYNKPTQNGYYAHFKAVAEVGMPVIVYNVPSRTASNIEAATILKLAELPNIVGTKESSGNLSQVMEIIRNRPPDFRVLSGDDYLALPIISLGGDGLVSVVSNEAPAWTRELVDAALSGDVVKARSLHYKLLSLMNANFLESNPVPVKAALAMMGLIEENYRLPLTPITPSNREKLHKILEDIGLLQSMGVH